MGLLRENALAIDKNRKEREALAEAAAREIKKERQMEAEKRYAIKEAEEKKIKEFAEYKQNVKKVIDGLSDYFDFVLIDCPAGIDEPFKRAVCGADEALVVVTPHLSSLRDADKVLMLLASYDISNISLVINRVRGDMVLDKEMIDSKKIAEILDTKLSGIIPEDDNITTFLSIGKAVNKGCESFVAFNLLAKNILGETTKVYDCTEKYKGVLGFLKRAIRRKL